LPPETLLGCEFLFGSGFLFRFPLRYHVPSKPYNALTHFLGKTFIFLVMAQVPVFQPLPSAFDHY